MSKKRRRKRRRLSLIGKLTITACLLCLAIVTLLFLYGIGIRFSFSPSATPTQETVYDFTSQDSYTVLINRQHPYAADYVPNDLVNYSDSIQLRKVANEALQELVAKAKEESIVIEVETGYRSYQDQETYFDAQVNLVGETKAIKNGDKQGLNEHQSGLAIDFSSTTDTEWLSKNAYLYGFILRYPEEKENITGVTGNLYHYRYVGKDVAKEMNNLSTTETLEEFFIQNS